MNKIDKEQFFFDLVDMMKYINKNDPDIKAYHHTRKVHQEVINSMNNFINKNNINPNNVLNSIEEKVDLEVFSLDFNSSLDVQIYYDLIIYPHLSTIKSVTETYLEKHTLRKIEKQEMLEAMKNSYVGIFEIIGRDDKKANTFLRNLITKEEISLFDFNLGALGTGSNNYIFIRVITFHGINFQTGLMMPFKRNVTTKTWIKRNRQLFVNNESAPLIVNLFDFYKKYGEKQAVIR